MFFTPPAVVEAANDMQRFFRFHNEVDNAIFPLISASQGTNCAANYGPSTLLRVIVNGKRVGAKASQKMRPSS